MSTSVNESACWVRVILGLIVSLPIGAACHAETEAIVLPTLLENVDANSESVFPMQLNDLGGFRIMQVYDAAPFLAASGGLPIAISQFAFRPDALLQTAPATMDITFRAYMSTTSRSPDLASPNFLSNVFADNIESPQVLMIDEFLSVSSAGAPGGGVPGPFDVHKPFATPFVYNPAEGNLLLDLRIERIESSFIVLDFARDDPAASDVARILGISADADEATVMAPFGSSMARTGLVTEFTYTVVPEPAGLVLVIAATLALTGGRRSRFARVSRLRARC